MARVENAAEEVEDQRDAQDGDGVDPDDLSDDAQPVELIMQLVEHDGQHAGSLRYEEPLRGEVPQRARQRTPRGLVWGWRHGFVLIPADDWL